MDLRKTRIDYLQSKKLSLRITAENIRKALKKILVISDPKERENLYERKTNIHRSLRTNKEKLKMELNKLAEEEKMYKKLVADIGLVTSEISKKGGIIPSLLACLTS